MNTDLDNDVTLSFMFLSLQMNINGSITGHANLLIYRNNTREIEHFEPHGSFLDLRPDYGDKISRILQLLIEKINEIKYY